MAELTQPLSKNFLVGELLRSATAERDVRLKAEQENPSEEVLSNLQYLTETALQPIRDGVGYPVRINSGYRCHLVNKLVGGSATSQHCRGEAADCELSRLFLKDSRTSAIRKEIKTRVRDITDRDLRPDVDANFYLFAYVCLHLDELDVDQVIHEYGMDFGWPAWVHIAASRRKNGRQVLFIGPYTNGRYVSASPEEALAYAASAA